GGVRTGRRVGGRGRGGESFRSRLRAADSRNVPEAKLGPNVVYFPDQDRWVQLHITRHADPLAQQDIEAQRDDIRKRLKDLIDELVRERRIVHKLKEESKDRNARLTGEQGGRLRELVGDHQGVQKKLTDLVRDMSLVPALARLAETAQSVNDNELRNADGSLQQAQKEARADPRRDQF